MRFGIKQVIRAYCNGSDSYLIMYERKGCKWKRIIGANSKIGKNGTSNNKIEGDKKTPLGMYTLDIAFGIANNPGTSKEYLKLTDEYYLVDDAESQYYNKLVNINSVIPDWKTAEHLYDYKKRV